MLNWLSQKQLDLKIWWDFQSFEQEESDRHREWVETAFSTSAVSEKLAEVKALALSEAENRFGERLADLRADRAAAIVERDWLERGFSFPPGICVPRNAC